MSQAYITRHAGKLILGIPILWIILFMLVPYGVLLTYSFWIKKYPLFVPAFQFGNYWTLLTDPQYIKVLLRTLKIAALVSAASLLLAYPLQIVRIALRGDITSCSASKTRPCG